MVPGWRAAAPRGLRSIPPRLGWVTASASRSGWAKRCPRVRTSSARSSGRPGARCAMGFTSSSANPCEQAVDPHRPRPLPDLPEIGFLVDREEQELRPAHQIFYRHVADRGKYAAVLRIVAVVAHAEVMAFRHAV